MLRFRLFLLAIVICFSSLSSTARAELLAETKGWGILNKGPADAKGLIYFVRGFTEDAAPDWYLVPYFLRTLNSDGWDVIIDRIRPGYQPNRDIQWPERRKLEIATALGDVQKRASLFKRSGYRTIVGAGHSFGGWVLLEATTRNPSLVDRVMLSAPTAHGKATIRSGKANVLFRELVSASGARFGQIKTSTFVAIFNGDEYEPAGRPAAVANAVKGNEKVFLVDRPAAFSGHFSAWTPIFDYVYGDCLKRFLEATSSTACAKENLTNDDWRSVVSFAPSLPAAAKPLTLDMLVGKQFVRYGLSHPNNFIEIASANAAQLKFTDHMRQERFRFSPQNGGSPGEICLGSDCGKLVAWNSETLLEFDRKTDQLKYWWLRN